MFHEVEVVGQRHALAAVSVRADGIVISNHGGRTLDGAVAPLKVLPSIVKAVGTKCSIILDGGVVRGSDVVKAIALGADAVMIGRAPLWGVAADGQNGVARGLEICRSEIDRVMAYIGCNSVHDLDDSVIFNAP